MGVNGIYGLSGSGLDVESMVKVGMLGKQAEYDKMQQKYTKDEWKKSEYLSLYGEIQTFNASTLSKYKMSSSMNSRSASSSNSSAVNATANANAATMTHYVEVGGLASSAYLIGTKSPTRTDSDVSKTQLSSVLFDSIAAKDGEDTIILVNGKEKDASSVAFSFSINDGVNGLLSSEDSDTVIATATPDAITGNFKVEVKETAKAAKLEGPSLGVTPDTKVSVYLGDLAKSQGMTVDDLNTYLSANAASNPNDAIAFTLGDGTGKTVDISYSYSDMVNLANGKTTFSDFIDNLNERIGDALGIKASISESGNLSFENLNVGSDNQIVIEIDKAKSWASLDTSNPAASSEKFDSYAAGILIQLVNGSGGSGHITGDSRINLSGDNIVMTLTGKDAEIKVTNDDTGEVLFDNTDTNYDTPTGTYATNAEDYTIDGNNLTFGGISFTSKETTDGVTITNDKTNQSASNVTVTYQELLDGFSFYDLTSKVNSMDNNIRFNYDSVQDRFSLYNKKSGAENQINIQIGNGDGGTNAAAFFNKLGLQQSSNGEIVSEALTFTTGGTVSQSGVNATAKIDGIEYNLDSNSVSVDGVTYNLSNVTAANQKVAVTVTQDTESIIKNVQSFVDDYNALLTKLYKWYDEKPNSDYKPLTSTQKEGMKEEQIEKWEEKAKAGLLYHDQTLGKIITEIRSAVTSNVEGLSGKYKNIFSLGISTTGLKGQLTLDKDKLNAALADDPDAVYNVFAKLDADDEFNSNGVAQRLGDVFQTSMKSVKSIGGSTADITEDSELNNLMRELQTKMSNFKKMMQAFESKLYKKYDAMESSLALLGSQLNYVTSAFQ